jgi:alpha-galactosidase
VLAGLHSAHGFGAASRVWHDYIRRHVLPRTDPRPVLYNSWEATAFGVSETGQAELAQRAARIGAELFVVDDGWFGIRDSDHAGLGDWHVDPRKFPNGLKPLVEEVRRLGMEFGIWVEPEMVNPDSDLYRAHPDWVISFPDRDRSEIRNQCMLNYARPDVRDWAFGWLDALVRDHGIAFLKWDHNRYVTEPGWSAYEGNDPQRFWVAHTAGVYDVIDRLRAAHPALQIESCAGGGGRVDLGILRRTEQFWTSDNTDALDRLRIQEGTSQVYPAIAMGCWVTDSPNQQTGRETSLTYRCHVAMMGALGIGADLTELTDAELDELARWIGVYKGIRSTVQLGDQYRLGPAVGYVAADRSQAVLLVATGNIERQGSVLAPIRLPGLDPDVTYDVRHQVAGWSGTATGRVLGAAGVTVPPLRELQSEVVILNRI